MTSFVPDEGTDTSPSSAMLRLLVFPAIVGFLFFGGVFWLRLQFDSAAGAPVPTAPVQVRLLPRPDPVPIPVNPTTPQAPTGPSTSMRESIEKAAIGNQALAAPAAEEPETSEPVDTSASSRTTRDSAPNYAILAFKSELLRHIAHFQRYPKAAERQHLQGTVQAVFSMSREGKVLGVWVKASSGQAVLDQAAIETIRRAQPLPSIPPNLPGSLKVEVALGFDPS